MSLKNLVNESYCTHEYENGDVTRWFEFSQKQLKELLTAAGQCTKEELDEALAVINGI